jgi:hypothetical protein
VRYQNRVPAQTSRGSNSTDSRTGKQGEYGACSERPFFPVSVRLDRALNSDDARAGRRGAHGVSSPDASRRIGRTNCSTRSTRSALLESHLSVRKNGRRNYYKVHADLPLRHPAYREYAISNLLRALSRPPKTSQWQFLTNHA